MNRAICAAMITTWEFCLRLGLAAAFGAAIGWEREAQHKPAGLRTHILVALGSALFMLAGMQLHYDLVTKNQANSADLMKVLEGVIGGIGFLGAGAIIQSRRGVSGLTTAATIWLTAAVGVASGLGYFRFAAISTVLALVVLLALGLLQQGADYLGNGKSGPVDPISPDEKSEVADDA